jgi:hypothetical protein
MSIHIRWFGPLVLLAAAAPAARAQDRPIRPAGRVSFFVNAARLSGSDLRSNSATFITTVTYGIAEQPARGVEFGLDLRQSRSASAVRPNRFSLFDAYVGARFANGAMRVRGGQMWLTDLGALGAVAGAMAEGHVPLPSSVGRLKVGGFFGIDPDTYELGYRTNVRKTGGYAVLEGAGGRRHVGGYVRIDHGGLVERSVVTITNFVPVRSRVFLYQVAEYDLSGPGGQGGGGLTYLFVNVRASVTNRLELQGLFNKGRSIDARTIVDDLLDGRTVSTQAIDGLLYESAGARLNVTVRPGLRVHAGLTRDRNNRDSSPTSRVNIGASADDIAGSGLDATASFSQIIRGDGRYQSTYLSVGRQIGRAVYASADFSSSVSIVRFTRLDGLTVDTRPETRQFGGSALINLTRHLIPYVTVTETIDAESRELRVLGGLTIRMR